MGCASLLTRLRIQEYSYAAKRGLQVGGGGRKTNKTAPVIQPIMDPCLGLNEVGLTDTIMATIWRLGPLGASYAVTSNVENLHLASDIAIIHRSAKRILLYQSKVACLKGTDFKLKSPVTQAQASELTSLASKMIKIGPDEFSVSTRLALYQVGTAANNSMKSSFEFGVPPTIGYGIVGLSLEDFYFHPSALACRSLDF
jgi:hypothetical protein